MSRSLIAALFVAVAAPGVAAACTCPMTDVIYSYTNNDTVFLGRPIASVHRPGYNIHRFRLVRDLKGCMAPGTIIEVGTPDNEAACGAEFNPGSLTIVFGGARPSVGNPRVYTTSCSGSMEASYLQPDDLDYLGSRPLTCGGVTTCVDGSSPVACPVDPCAAAPPCAGAVCVSNTCGGCTAEFYDAWGYGACLPW